MAQPAITPADRTRLETLHGQLLHESEDATRSSRYDASVARYRAAVVARVLGWVA